jgi:N-acetylmuramoyl-L-alanine amidase
VCKFAVILFCGALLFLAGCATAPGDNEGALPSNWNETRNETNIVTQPSARTPVPAVPPVVKISPAVKINLPPPPVQSNPTPVQVVRPATVPAWTSLNRWAAENQCAAPRRLVGGPIVSYALRSPHGELVVDIGSREATWRGVEFHLGFPPEFIDDQVFVHGLDLQKNLAPLLLGESSVLGTNRVIVIDPGHGGMNGGTVSTLDGRPEKEFTLDWARRIQALLTAEGWTVWLTRTNDVDVALSNRVAFAEARHAGLFVSLHFNSAAPDKRQSGLETYCLTPAGMPSTLTRGNPDFLNQSFPNNEFDVPNLLLAVRLHAALLRLSGEEDRGIRRARFMGVLHGEHCPAILIEGGFLSNPREAGKIESAGFRQKLAEAFAAALK